MDYLIGIVIVIIAIYLFMRSRNRWRNQCVIHQALFRLAQDIFEDDEKALLYSLALRYTKEGLLHLDPTIHKNRNKIGKELFARFLAYLNLRGYDKWVEDYIGRAEDRYLRELMQESRNEFLNSGLRQWVSEKGDVSICETSLVTLLVEFPSAFNRYGGEGCLVVVNDFISMALPNIEATRAHMKNSSNLEHKLLALSEELKIQ